MARFVRSRSAGRLSVIALVVGGTVLSTSSLAFAGGPPTSFTAGDLVVDQVTESGAAPSSTAGVVALVDYSTSGTPSGFSVTLPSSAGAPALVDSGTATNDGDITLSADGNYLYVTGYDAAAGTTKITSATDTPRVVGIVNSTGTADISTQLADSTTEAQNIRSATGPTGATSDFYNAGGAGLGYTADGATSNDLIDTGDNTLHEVQIYDGNLYASTTKNIIEWSGLPTSGPVTGTAIIPSPPSGFGANGFALVTLGSGSTPNALYVADTGANQVEKYSLVSGAWTLTGTVSVDDPTGLVVSTDGTVASIYITNGVGSNTYATEISELTDSSGVGGTLPSNTTVNLLATAGADSSFHGLAFAPGTSLPAMTPETSVIILLPAVGALIFGGGYVAYRRRYRTT